MESGSISENELISLLLSTTRQGDVKSLESYLSKVTNPSSYLNRTYDHEESMQKYTLLTVACLDGFEDVVNMLLDRFKPDLEVLNNVKIEGGKVNQPTYFDVSVLWTAASTDNFRIVQALVEHGANVNHTTKTNSTPLRAACYNGNVSIARYLVEHGANIHIVKENNDTNLMVSVSRQHVDMVTYLVDELHCDVNMCDNDGRSSLYDAVNGGSLELVEFLLKHGARNFRATIDQMSPLMWAAEKRHHDLMKAISSQCSLLEQIEAEELLGSAFIYSTRNNRDFQRAFKHFYHALELRCVYLLLKPTRSIANDIFDDQQECQTIDELNKIRSDVDRMYVEALLIRERLLGSMNAEYRYSLRYRGAILADNERHQEAVSYFIYELGLCQQHTISLDSKHLRNLASFFSDMLFKMESLSITTLLTVISAILTELDRNKQNFNYNLCTLLFLITITSQFSAKNRIPISECRSFYCQVRLINQRNYTTMDFGMSLLHLSLDQHTVVDDYHIRRICKYPCLQTARILLQCGAAVNAFDAVRNTPLHILTSGQSTCHESILNLLYNAGVHLDYANALGERPIDMATNLETRQLLRSRTELKLKCLCARLIRKKNIPFSGKISISLITFVEKH